MSSSTNLPDSAAISDALNQLEHLDANEYVVALGPEGRQFCATPNGYTASFLPQKVVATLATGCVKKIVWASFGSVPDSWFFAYELKNGTASFQLGTVLPPGLKEFIGQISNSAQLASTLRVQLGDGDAFVMWTQTIWACSKVPQSLRLKLSQLSFAVMPYYGGWRGAFRLGKLDIVQWHRDGSFYIKSDSRHMWKFEASILIGAWEKFWQREENSQRDFKIRTDLAHVAIDPHTPIGDSFAMMKKQEPGQEVPFILHFGQECVQTNVPPNEEPALMPLVSTTKPMSEPQWAVSKKATRPHRADTWELKLKKGERVLILHDMGRDWFIARGKAEIKGWVHGSRLDFGVRKPHAKPNNAYDQFQEDLKACLFPGKLSRFLPMKDYIDACTLASCQAIKGNTSLLGICAHDLKILLEGSGDWSHEWLKEGRNMWHPDRFARFCHRKHVQQLKPLAEEMFALYTTLMETC